MELEETAERTAAHAWRGKLRQTKIIRGDEILHLRMRQLPLPWHNCWKPGCRHFRRRVAVENGQELSARGNPSFTELKVSIPYTLVTCMGKTSAFFASWLITVMLA